MKRRSIALLVLVLAGVAVLAAEPPAAEAMKLVRDRFLMGSTNPP